MAVYYSELDPCLEKAHAAAGAVAEARDTAAAPALGHAGEPVRASSAAANRPAPFDAVAEVQSEGTATASPLQNNNWAGPALGIRPAAPYAMVTAPGSVVATESASTNQHSSPPPNLPS